MEDLPELFETDTDFLNVERIHALENIVRHYAGLDHLTKENLEEFIVSLPIHKDVSSHDQEHPEQKSIAELAVRLLDSPGGQIQLQPSAGSLSEITQTIGKQQACLVDDVALDSNSSQLLSHGMIVVESASVFPTFNTASSLVSIFFEFGQMNYFYVDELMFRSSIEQFYKAPCTLNAQDAPWVCTALMVFAIGAQFSHLQGGEHSPKETTQEHHIWLDDALALMFFRQASKLVPDVLAISSLESVQALLLMGFYLLPLEHCLRIATDCCLEADDNTSITAREIEVRRRVWCTAFILERRNSVYHGKSLAPTRPPVQDFDMLGNVDMSSKRIDTHQNTKKAIQQVEKLQHVLDTRDQLLLYWDNLPDNIFGRDLCPQKPLFRHNAYLALSYHSIHIFIGRPFILDRTIEETMRTGLLTDTKSKLITSCIESALAIVDLCQRIKDQSSLSRSSYIEFTSCHAAVSALVAASISDRTSQWNKTCRQGLDLLRAMLGGVFSQSGGRKDLDRLDQLLCYNYLDFSEEMNDVTYQDFLHWGASFLNVSS
ncbi:unnamed protein product [Fusarium venenatum]|uniref:Xylanolytic transcriptional activator regulatory domain-containing protein n=1 Tax=Fusarium venenatum TaxID=56646 RepID=A0A2L2SZN1_9HYPO|nr:uncharacterized protein FVRRES_00134 [Fusarium venenatum]CEI63622.1 unnamed protein product [Fusarium venenatum]